MHRSHRLARTLFDHLLATLPGFRAFVDVELRETHARIRPASTVCCVGCGDGREIAAIAGRCARVIGIDWDPREIDAARMRVGHLPNVELLAGDIFATPVSPASVDVVVLMWNTLGLLGRPPGEFATYARGILRPGGRVLAGVFRADAAAARVRAYHRSGNLRARAVGGDVVFSPQNVSAGFTEEQLAGTFRAAGFTTEVVPAGPIGLFLDARLPDGGLPS